MSGYACHKNAHNPEFSNPIEIPLIRATAENLKGYGHFVHDFDNEKVEITVWPKPEGRPICKGTGTNGGIVSGRFEYYWKGELCHAINHAVKAADDEYTIGRLARGVAVDNRSHVLIREANYHPDGGQVFYPEGVEPFVAFLALPGDDKRPEDFRGFYFDGTCGLQIHANVWHQPIYPINDRAMFKGKQGAVHACVDIDFVNEFANYVKLPILPELIT